MTAYRFAGRERITIELDGWFDPAALALPAGLVPELEGGRARVSLFAFHVDALRVIGVPLVRASYAEVLWRIAVRRGDTPAWWVAACDLDARARLAAWAARRWVRYPVRRCAVAVTETGATGAIALGGPAGAFACTVGPGEASAGIEARELLTGQPGALSRVPWGDDRRGASRAPVRHLTDTLGAATLGRAVAWANTAIVRRGRAHRCGAATTA